MSPKKIFIPVFLSTGTIFAFIVSFVKPDLSYSEINITPTPKLNPVTSTQISSTQTSTQVSITQTPSPQTSSTPTPSNQKKVDKITPSPQPLQKLNVLSLRCIGCGRCANTDSAHFEIINDKAVVISSTNLNSQNLAIAINNCPVQAITLQ